MEGNAKIAYQNADKYANWAVEETGFGVAAHKKIKNELTTFPLVEFYQDKDFVNTIVDKNQKIVKIPRPAGVIIALVPSTNPIATINYKTILSLMTRNAIVISPHPAARACSVDATYTLIEAALDAGAPDGSIQIIEKPTIPLIEELMKSSKTSVTLATGGSAMVRSAYSSSNPAIGVGPGNAPVYVDLSADLEKAAKNIIESKSFDNSVLCTSESVLITLKEIDKRLKQSFRQAGAYICNEDDVIRLRRYLCPGRGLNLESVGRDELWIANDNDGAVDSYPSDIGFLSGNIPCQILHLYSPLGVKLFPHGYLFCSNPPLALNSHSASVGSLLPLQLQ